MSQLLRQSEELVLEGHELIKVLRLEKALAEYGKVTIDGSLSYELMFKPDIDVGVWVDSPSLSMAAEASKYFASRGDVQRTFVSNHLDFKSRLAHQPNGVYLGLNVPVGERMWNFDIWFLQPGQEAHMPGLAEDWYKHLSRGQKDAILSLKKELMEAGEYGDVDPSRSPLNSADVYRGVVLGGVGSVGELRDWLAQGA